MPNTVQSCLNVDAVIEKFTLVLQVFLFQQFRALIFRSVEDDAMHDFDGLNDEADGALTLA
ncbi:hypothetical protein DPMN_017323 [Dreissena polymorpha]|uniref:Uncharacterized protein n=1 Tax=Dreissena polymorpha TaxID=45954 RepID=A0A9D4NGF8_DREPO|nr:hypothetical protein DPMN_017323 [Dreissena polymorpha]